VKRGDIKIVERGIHRRLEARGGAEEHGADPDPEPPARSTPWLPPTMARRAGVVAALTSKGIKGIPVSGQDGDFAALNRVALGSQTVSVWKDARDLGREAASRRGRTGQMARRSITR